MWSLFVCALSCTLVPPTRMTLCLGPWHIHVTLFSTLTPHTTVNAWLSLLHAHTPSAATRSVRGRAYAKRQQREGRRHGAHETRSGRNAGPFSPNTTYYDTETSKLHATASNRIDHLWVRARRSVASERRVDNTTPWGRLGVNRRHFESCAECNYTYAHGAPCSASQEASASSRHATSGQQGGYESDSGDSGVPCGSSDRGTGSLPLQPSGVGKSSYNYSHTRGTSVETNPIHSRRFDLAPY